MAEELNRVSSNFVEVIIMFFVIHPKKVFFIILVFINFLIGIYLISQNSITGDEPAYLGAAYAYSQGLGLNVEHPLLLKLINGVSLKLFFPNLPQVSVPIITQMQNYDSTDGRLGAFQVGYNLLMSNPEQFFNIIFVSRFGYLLFNSIFLIWLYFYTFIFKFINPDLSLIFLSLYIFSPSFYSHSFLATFDVPAALYGLASILSVILLSFNLSKLSKKLIALHFIINTILIFLAINTKFSNLIIIPVIIGVYGITLFYLIRDKQKNLAIYYGSLAILSFLVQIGLINILYDLAFGNLSQPVIQSNFEYYWQGIKMNLNTSNGVREPFFKDRFLPINYLQYLLIIFWFKENPGLLIMIVIILVILINSTQKNRDLFTKIDFFTKIKINLNSLLILAFILYPIIYMALLSKSRLIIGYRYFYPILIFLYLFTSITLLILSQKSKKQQLIIGMCLSIYMIFGIVGIPQSLSYVNPLWFNEKWQLTDDSTINWGQENYHAVQYLINNKLLPEKNVNIMAQQTFGVIININQYLEIIAKQKNYPIDIQSYYSHPPFNPLEDEITKLPDKYLLIDSTVKQKIIANASQNSLAAQNLNYLETHKPIYSHNEIMFIYQLR